MKMKQKALSTIAASALALGALAPVAHAEEAEVSAAIGASNMYYWRGLDLGGGAAVWGDISASYMGFYAGLWGSSGDEALGTEYDIYVGYGTDIAGFGVDIAYATYVYPSVPDAFNADTGEFESQDSIDPGDVAEVILGLSYGPVSLDYHHGVEDLEDYWYTKLGVDVGSFNFAYGLHEDDLAHIDATYNYNDNLSFTLGKVVDDVDGAYNDDLKFVATFALPIDF